MVKRSFYLESCDEPVTSLGPVRRRSHGLTTAVAGTLLIASTYGMARFGVGLYAPRIEAQRPALSGVLGLAGAAQFLSYAIAAVLAGLMVDRRPRTGLVLAGLSATLGCLAIASTSNPALFILAVFVAGMGGGFASPALVRVVDAVVSERTSSAAQSLVNAGTAVGVLGAGLVSFVAIQVGAAWIVMAGVCAVAAVATLYSAAGHELAPSSTVPARKSPGDDGWLRLGILGVAALVVGAGSALLWTFGPSLTTRSGTVSSGHVGWLWVALGVGGMLGPLTSSLTNRLGLRGGWCAFAWLLTVAEAMLALSVTHHSSWMAYGAMSVFGAGYMCMSGALIHLAREIHPAAAGAATSLLFVALAIGQAVGSVCFGAVRDHLGPATPALAGAALCALGGVLGLVHRDGDDS